MTDQGFTHLHVHTDASLRDGLGTVPRLIGRAKDLGFTQIAMTDHGTLANAITFSLECQAQGVKPLIGLEGYVEFDGEIGHITLLADGARGWNSLLLLNNIAHASDLRQPAFSVDDLVKFNAGLVCLTGCIASPFQQLPEHDAYRLGLRLKSVFGGRLFAELMFVGDSLAWERPLKLASRLDLAKVITNDVHFAYMDDGGIHPILTKMKAGFDYDSKSLWLKNREEMLEAATRFGLNRAEASFYLDMTQKIGTKLNEVELAAKPRLPEIKGTRSLEYLIGIGPRRGKTHIPEYWDRLQHELNIIRKMEYEDYFLILDDIIQKAKRMGVKVGPGRGSGCGSLTLYLLGITDIDPIKHGLKFERFLNPERVGMPDVDVDIDSEGRDKVLAYAAEKYGAIPIATYSRYSHKSLTRDLGKMFMADKGLVGKAADGGDTSDAFIELAKFSGPRFGQAYEAFQGQIRHKGKHAGGVIITDTPVPIERAGDQLVAAWTEGQKNELSYAGIVKFDLLGLSVLSALKRLESKFERVPEQPTDGSLEFSIFMDGDLAGIFQFSGSDGIRKLTMELAPTKFEDLVAINALYRPGSIDSGHMAKFAGWKKRPRKVPAYIKDILEETHGAIVYQEQVMEIYARTVDGSLGEADDARRLISKAKEGDLKWEEKFAELRRRFLLMATSLHGLLLKDAQDLWNDLATHSRYSFNKSHSTAYAQIAWECAWWKFHYPASFYAAMLSVDTQQEQTYIIEAVKFGIRVQPPHVNIASDQWESSEGEDIIYMPLGAIKFLGGKGVEAILEQRKAAGGNFRDLEHFMKIVPKKFVRARARAGLFSLGGFKKMWGVGMEPIDLAEYVKKVLVLKDLPILGLMRNRQLKYLGVIIPDLKMLEQWEALEESGWKCGIIKNRDARESKWGPYMVYRLSPQGVFWSREVMDLEKGEVVGVQISDKNGKAEAIKIL